METTGREQIKTETEGEIRGTKNGADFFDEPKKLVRVKRETEKDVVVEHCLGWVILNYLYWEKWASIGKEKKNVFSYIFNSPLGFRSCLCERF